MMAARSSKKAPAQSTGLTLTHFYALLAILLLVAFSLDVSTGILALITWYVSSTIGAARVRRIYVKPKARKTTRTAR